MEEEELLKCIKKKKGIKKERDRIKRKEKRKKAGEHRENKDLVLPRGSIMEHFLVHHQ